MDTTPPIRKDRRVPTALFTAEGSWGASPHPDQQRPIEPLMFGLQFSLTPKKRHKLRREPLKFFVDAIRNRAAVVTSLAQRSITYLPVSGFLHSERRYTAIAAVYNVESYLEKFFVSMASQTLSFSDHIELIMVDDGSTDASAQIIERWRRRFPQTIRYLYKENGGQASARNLGLQYATGDWVTFVDPDDFVHFRYFEAVDRFLKQYETERIGMLCCKWVFFHEKGNRYVDDHPLNFRFDHGSYAALFHPRAEVVLSSAARSFFRAETVAREGIRFDESLRPRFEDGDFSARYALKMENERVGYVADAIYYYRKRSDGSSTLDRDWEDPDRFGVVVERGYLKLLRDTDRELGVVPLSIQWLVLYDLIWLYKKVIDDEASISFLTDEQKGRLRELLFEVFEYLDSDHIMNFEIAGCSFFHRVGFLGLYKQEDPPVQIAYVEGYDGTKNLALLKWFCPGEPATECFCVNGVEVIPAYAKVRVHDFLSDVFVNERRAWVRLGEGASSLSLEVDGKPVTIAVEGVSFDHGVIRTEIEQLIQARRSEVTPNVVAMGFRRLARSRRVEARFRDAWLLLDRDKQADDNAEHLYRHIMRNHPEINAFFVLKKSSHDWERLETEGFRLIAFGSRDHHLLMLNAKHVVSSHIDSFVVNVLPWKWYGDMFTYKFTFLQHGVIRDDISRWLNGKRIDLFVTSSPGEHESIAGDVSRYKFGRLQTRMVGLARHDALIERTEKTEKVILIMPTWR
ncbi:MAG: hypothetical protein DRI90_02485, partial [Deltaproteobacteria bacterium]